MCEAAHDRAAASFLQGHGVDEPSAADVAYVQEGVGEAVTAFVKTIVKMKPLDLNRFGMDYFSGALQAQKRLVLISSDAGDVDALKAAVRKVGDQGAPIVTAVWNYEGTPSNLTQLLRDLVTMHGTFKTIALVGHGGGSPVDDPPEEDEPPPKWFLTCDHGVDFEQAQSDLGVDDFIQALADAASVRVDMLACSFADSKQGKEWIAKWEKKTATNFAASTNCTGNAEVGGDWVLETDGVDVCSVYFHVDQLEKWQVALGKGKYACEATQLREGRWKRCPNTTNYETQICGACKRKGIRPAPDSDQHYIMPNGERKCKAWYLELARVSQSCW